ncbi:conserved hypothetical protein [Culex quinquefasciatus]|uniref:Uncharacterized protein n=1 Tax=Culex quinquefasciatus TaxID=7176 RepID=B0WNH3_CULQU|nr:conserved hypothetical protein [Culex quinquefasciatus]|eukprot:XP_001850257.1 conserved hypothetical protein [Culex quinquefasciatus]
MSKSPSSETTSETLSVSDESIATSVANSVSKGGGPSKIAVKKVSKDEPARERPPWRPASVAQGLVPPAPKPDLRARILDMSKRLRRVNASVQTDPVHTKLMKEASTDEQRDLIPMVDEGISTDGNLVIREIGNFILTHSVAQMTESVPTLDTATQTAMPRSGVSFRKFLENGGGDGPAPKVVVDEATPLEEEPSKDCASSLDELLKIDEKIKQFFNIPELDVEMAPEDQESHSSDSIKEHNTPDLLAGSSQEQSSHKSSRFLEPPTFSSWQNLDFSDEESDHYVARELPRRTFSEGNRPWAEFKDLVIGNRLANMRLSPIPPRKPRAPNKKTVTWSDTQHRAVSDLLHEATALVDMFDQVSMLLGPDIKLHAIPPPTQDEFQLPPPKWEPLLVKSCDLLEEKLARVRHLNFDDLDDLMQPVELRHINNNGRTQPFVDIEVTL